MLRRADAFDGRKDRLANLSVLPSEIEHGDGGKPLRGPYFRDRRMVHGTKKILTGRVRQYSLSTAVIVLLLD
jgi:hypothetical protein